MIIWIQRHDFSYEELEANSLETAIDAFEKFDWKVEIKKEKASEEESCPPGFGIVTDDGYILHVCPNEIGKCRIHFHYPEKEKYFFIFTRVIKKTINRENISWDNSILLIGEMFVQDWEQMKTMI